MNITRANYENYFLLYADGELDDAGKQAVETFVTLHPDLEEELEMLMDTILADENITMPGKELLLKTELWQEETMTPQQQSMLLMFDNEMPEAESGKLLEQIATDPSLKKEWEILQQTRLTPVAVVMPGKESLYHNERDRRPIPIGWVKWMAAAAVIAGLGWFGLNWYSNSQRTMNPQVAVNIKGNRHATLPATTPAGSVTDASQQHAILTAGNATAAVQKEPAIKQTKPAENVNQQVLPPVENSNTPAVQYAVNKNEPLVETITEPQVNTNTVATIDPKELNPVIQTTQYTEPAQTLAQQAVYNEDAVDEPEYVNIAGARIKKQKLRGVFRNVTRTIGRTFDKSNVAQADIATLR